MLTYPKCLYALPCSTRIAWHKQPRRRETDLDDKTNEKKEEHHLIRRKGAFACRHKLDFNNADFTNSAKHNRKNMVKTSVLSKNTSNNHWVRISTDSCHRIEYFAISARTLIKKVETKYARIIFRFSCFVAMFNLTSSSRCLSAESISLELIEWLTWKPPWPSHWALLSILSTVVAIDQKQDLTWLTWWPSCSAVSLI